jgi:hypothetical protein
MNKRFAVGVISASLALASASVAFAQEAKYPEILDAKPMFAVLPNHPELAPKSNPTTLVQWNGTFTDITKKTITFTMIGTDPTSTNTSTTVPVYIIPVKMKYPKANGNATFDPKNHVLANGKTVINNIIASPLFDAGLDFTQGGTDLGTTQYEDAFQRGNFWSTVASNSGYHVLLGNPVVLPEKTITVSSSTLGTVISNPFGSGIVGTYDINSFDTQLQTWITAQKKITPGVLPIFITYDIFLTSGGCCIGGYHSANGAQPSGQTYSVSTYVDSPGSFSQDVSALSHELGEWMDDPFVDNHVDCRDNSILEVGDPLEGTANYGGYPYTLNGFTYNLQSLVFLGYFGAPPSTSVHSWLAFQNDEAHVCPGQ